jgi:uncharacterized membrane protein (UPF0127 family)
MGAVEKVDWEAGVPTTGGAAAPAPQVIAATMGSRVHCAYNQTRECFLGLEVKAVDLSAVHVGELLLERPLNSGEGVWMRPFRGIPAIEMPAPLDLIYLDESRRVIDAVESFPTFQVSSFSPQPASVLALPAHSIYSSQTQTGDQLVLCVAEEMQQQLERLSGSRSEAVAAPAIAQTPSAPAEETPTVAGVVLLREQPLWSEGPGLLKLEDPMGQEKPPAKGTYEMELVTPGKKPARQPRNWLGRWWAPDPRKAPRHPAQGLAAYFWNGSAPAAHTVRDISSSGLYLVTEERWFPGTLVLMTLQRTDCGEEIAERTIAVQSRAVRWGPDGVGLQFILLDHKEHSDENTSIFDAVGRKEFDRFLEQLKIGN